MTEPLHDDPAIAYAALRASLKLSWGDSDYDLVREVASMVTSNADRDTAAPTAAQIRWALLLVDGIRQQSRLIERRLIEGARHHRLTWQEIGELLGFDGANPRDSALNRLVTLTREPSDSKYPPINPRLRPENRPTPRKEHL